MIRLLIPFLLATACVAKGAPPTLPLPEHPTCADLAHTANRFIGLGEVGTVSELKQLCELSKEHGITEDRMSEQVGWICRLLFVPAAGQPIREPSFGGLRLPWNTMKDEDWPLYPLVESEGVFFVLAQGYILAGFPEDPQQYLDYCRTNGTFRKQLVQVPTEEEAQRALDRLLSPSAWVKIKWKDSLWNSSDGEANVIAYLKAQTKSKANQ
jgi:hypothetical protein